MTQLSKAPETPREPPQALLMNYAQAAKLLGRSATWLQRQVRYGTVPYRRLGRSVGFTHEDVEEIVRSAYRTPGAKK